MEESWKRARRSFERGHGRTRKRKRNKKEERKKERKKKESPSFNESADRVSDKICELKFLPRFKGNFVIRDGESLLKGIGSVIRSWAGGWWPVVFLKDDRANLGAARFHCLESNWITV